MGHRHMHILSDCRRGFAYKGKSTDQSLTGSTTYPIGRVPQRPTSVDCTPMVCTLSFQVLKLLSPICCTSSTIKSDHIFTLYILLSSYSLGKQNSPLLRQHERFAHMWPIQASVISFTTMGHLYEGAKGDHS